MKTLIKKEWGYIACLCTFALLHNVKAENDLSNALVNDGKLSLNLRYRFEHVDDNALRSSGATLDQANASTLRTFVGYETGFFHGFSATLAVENVVDIGSDNFNDGSNGKTQFATVVDPSGTELEQGFLKFTNIDNTVIKAGRQYITYRKTPFHRYIGTILWRQNWQNFDAISLKSTSLADTTINYAYIWNVNRIFGSDAPEPLSNFNSNSHFININYNALPIGKLEAYSYLLDFNNANAFSTQTYGLRLNGKQTLNQQYAALYALEYAHQSDFADNPTDINASYFLGELGLMLKPRINFIKSLTIKINYELLSGDGGTDRFVTILGTNHAFQGWADRFLITPGDGIEDIYASLIMSIAGTKFVAVYHDFSSDNNSYDYGNELNLLLTKTFQKRFTLGLKYADYNADDNAINVARNAAQSSDKSNFWAFAQFKY